MYGISVSSDYEPIQATRMFTPGPTCVPVLGMFHRSVFYSDAVLT